MANAIEAGRAFMRLFLDDNAFRRGLDAAGKRVTSFGKTVAALGSSVAAIGTGITTPFLGAAKVFADTGEAMGRMANRTGETVENLSALKFAAEQSGVEFDDLIGAAEELNIRLGEAAREGTGPLAETFAKLGLDAQELIKLPLTERLKTIGSALNSLGDNAARGFAADEILGGDAFRLLPLLTGNIDELTSKAGELGLVMSGDTAAAATELATAFRVVLATAKSITVTIGSSIVGDLGKFIEIVTKISTAVLQWAKDNKALLATIFRVGVVIAIIGTALVGLGGAVIAAGAVLSGMATILTTLGAVASAVVSPLGLIVAAIAGVGVAIVKYTSVGAAGVEYLRDAFGSLLEPVKTTFSGIVDALSAGDIKLAAQVLMAEVNLIFTSGVAKIREIWAPVQGFLVGLWFDAVAGISLAISGLQEVMARAVGFIREAWAKLGAGVASTWAEAQNAVTRTVLQAQKFITERLTGEEFDISVELNQADRELNSTLEAIRNATNEATTRAREETAAKVASIRETGQGALEEIDRQERERRKEIADQISASADAAREAREKLDALAANAAGAAEAAREGRDDGRPPLADLFDKAAAGLQAAGDKIESVGTFSSRAVAAQLTPAASLGKQQLDAAKRTEENTKKIAENTSKFGGVIPI